MQYHLAISGMDCTGCGVCIKACPTKALNMTMLQDIQEQNDINWDFTINGVAQKHIENPKTVKDSQFNKPYFEFSGACAGCGETPYLKMITQLYGDHMRIANSAGCTHIWGGSPEIPFCTNEKGRGVAWASGLFEDTAEYGYGMYLGTAAVRKWLKTSLIDLAAKTSDAEIKTTTKNTITN